jgi:UDP-N-acetylglucosamine:LPS N-acetylglucosamine transferase
MSDVVIDSISINSSGGAKVLAVASGGGHWIQLMRIAPALEQHRITYVTTLPGCRSQVSPSEFLVVTDASRWNKFKLVLMALQVLWILLRQRPDVVITTGAAPGYLAVRIGKWLGARTVWIDSIANVEELSLSGRKAGRFVDLWLTQWPHLASADGPRFAGAVL